MKHIIWDFNGTLLNDAQLSVDLDNYVFDRIGVPRITLEDYRNNMTMPVRDFYPLVGVNYDAHSYEEIARIWLDEFNRKAIGVGLLPGALEAIQRLHAQGRSQSVLSASYEPSLKKQCDALGLTPYMRDI
ncbi:MAG: HAD family hydrolase, partial [Christensenellales bacterium]